jgi:hypothetical protein
MWWVQVNRYIVPNGGLDEARDADETEAINELCAGELY